MNNLILSITQGAQLVGTLAPIGIDLATKIKGLLAKDPELTVTLHALQEGTIATADETLAMIRAWEESKDPGLEKN